MEKVVGLCDVLEQKKVLVFKIVGLPEKLTCRINELGLVKNQKIVVIKNLKKSKTMVVCVRGCLIALDYELAKSILVREVCCE